MHKSKAFQGKGRSRPMTDISSMEEKCPPLSEWILRQNSGTVHKKLPPVYSFTCMCSCRHMCGPIHVWQRCGIMSTCCHVISVCTRSNQSGVKERRRFGVVASLAPKLCRKSRVQSACTASDTHFCNRDSQLVSNFSRLIVRRKL